MELPVLFIGADGSRGGYEPGRIQCELLGRGRRGKVVGLHTTSWHQVLGLSMWGVEWVFMTHFLLPLSLSQCQPWPLTSMASSLSSWSRRVPWGRELKHSPLRYVCTCVFRLSIACTQCVLNMGLCNITLHHDDVIGSVLCWGMYLNIGVRLRSKGMGVRWYEVSQTKRECLHIVGSGGGTVVLGWNMRRSWMAGCCTWCLSVQLIMYLYLCTCVQ